MENSINGKDLKTLFGLIIKDGTDSFLSYPRRKDSSTNDFRDKDGVDIDLVDPHFEAREFRLSVLLLATSKADFWSKHNGFFTELSGSGVHELYLKDLDKIFYVLYKDAQNFKRAARLSSDTPGVTFDLVLSEADPSANMEKVYLVDDDDNFLIA